VKCPSCETPVSGYLNKKGYIWCHKCERRICTEAAFFRSEWSWLTVPDAEHVLVWQRGDNGKRHMALVEAWLARKQKLERVKL
jgi:hypothetical protein